MKTDLPIENAIKKFSKLPGFGPRSARKIILHFLKNKNIISEFIANLQELEREVKVCLECHNLSTFEVCEICSNENRERNKLCIVCDVDDIWSIEKSATFKGIYHSLGGSLSAVAGITPEKLNLASLFNRLTKNDFDEVIFANNLSVEGATTVFYIIDEIESLKSQGIIKESLIITELANGIPIGASLEYMDEGTLKVAFSSRKTLKY
jgi:recombination protein RecR